MCYLRNFFPIQNSVYTKDQVLGDSDCSTENFDNIQEKPFGDFKFLENQKPLGLLEGNTDLLVNLLKLAQKNSQALLNISIKMQENDFLLDQMQDDSSACKSAKPLEQSNADTEESIIQEETSFKTQQFLTKKLFGENKQYKYKLILDGNFPQQVFKQRNFAFNIKLTDLNGNLIRNSNIIHLCLGVCDVNGQWVTETKTKQTLMKGNTQSELYHGEASYTKIFSRDVSRNYSDGKLNIVVYPKQSVLRYCQGSNFLEQSVHSNEIEPLVLKDLTIKAKKKQC